MLAYYPGVQNWRLGSYDDGSAAFNWSDAGNSSGFGNLLAGHKFWVGNFNRHDRDQILFYYPGDGNRWRGSYNRAAGRLEWSAQRVSRKEDTGDLSARHYFREGSFSRSDRKELLVYSYDRRRFCLTDYMPIPAGNFTPAG